MDVIQKLESLLKPDASTGSDWVDKVNARSGSILSAEYEGTTLETLARFLSDLKFANNTVQDQGQQRRIVSCVFLYKMTLDAVFKWVHPTFGCMFPDVHGVPNFMVTVVQGVTKCKPVMSKGVLDVASTNWEVFVVLEKTNMDKVPCNIIALDVKGFRKHNSLALQEKVSILLNMTNVSKLALEEYMATNPTTPTTTMVTQEMEYIDIKTASGTKITERRTSDGYINATMLLKSGGSTYRAYKKVPSNRRFMTSFKHVDDKKQLIEDPGSIHGTVWTHPRYSIHMSKWDRCNQLVKELPKLLGEIPEDITEVIVNLPKNPDVVTYQVISFDGLYTIRRSSDMFVECGQLCKSLGERWGNYAQTDDFKSFLNDLAKKLQKPHGELVIITHGSYPATWGHEDIAMNIVHKRRPTALVAFTDVLAAPIPPDSETHTILRDKHGKVVTKVRSTDGFHDVVTISHNAPKQVAVKDFEKTRHIATLLEEMRAKHGPNLKDVVIGVLGGTWYHPEVAPAYAKRCLVGDFDSACLREDFQDEANEGVDNALQEEASTEKVTLIPPSIPLVFETDHPAIETEAKDLASATAFVESLFGEDGNLITEIRKSDGYVNATKMCKSAGKKWRHFWENASTQSFLELLERKTGIPLMKLVETTRGGHQGQDNHGTWVYPKVAIKLAAWCSPEFEIQVTDVLLRYMTGRVTTTESLNVASLIRQHTLLHSNESFTWESSAALVPSMQQPVIITPLPPGLDTMGTPMRALAPFTFYIILIGHASGMLVFKYGYTEDLKARLRKHRQTYPNMVLRLVVTMGRYGAQPVEDDVKMFLLSLRVKIDVGGVVGNESFIALEAQSNYVLRRTRDFVQTKFADWCEYSNLDHEEMELKKPPGDSDEVKIEKEKTKQAEELTKQLQLQLQLKRLEQS